MCAYALTHTHAYRYDKMRKMLPEGAVRQKMMTDGFSTYTLTNTYTYTLISTYTLTNTYTYTLINTYTLTNTYTYIFTRVDMIK